MLRIAIISFSHAESSLVLSEYIARKGHQVDYYYVARRNQSEAPSFSFNIKNSKPGINSIIQKREGGNAFFLSDNLSLKLITLFQIARRSAFLEKMIIRKACRKIRQKNYDVINLVGQHNWLLCFHKALNKNNRVHTLHEVSPHYKKQALTSQLIRYLEKKRIPIIVHSQYTKNKLQENVCPEMHSRIGLIPFGLFETYRLYTSQLKNNLQLSDKMPYALFYGFIRPYKGLETLYDAVQLLPKELNLRFVIAGSGKDSVLRKMQVDRRFIILNKNLSNEEIVNLNQNALFIVCPYTSASQSGIISTTYLFEKPIISSNVGAFSEFIEDGVNGLLTDVGNAKDLSAKIKLLFTDRNLYNRLCEGAKFFPHKFNWEQISKDTIAFYKTNKASIVK